MLAGGAPGGSVPQPVAGYRASLHLQVPDPDTVVRHYGGHAGDPQRQPYGRIADCPDDQGVSFQLRGP